MPKVRIRFDQYDQDSAMELIEDDPLAKIAEYEATVVFIIDLPEAEWDEYRQAWKVIDAFWTRRHAELKPDFEEYERRLGV